MTEGNGHPYSWSAIFNNYDRAAMTGMSVPGDSRHLNRVPPETIGILGAKVTCVYCDRRRCRARRAPVTHSYRVDRLKT